MKVWKKSSIVYECETIEELYKWFHQISGQSMSYLFKYEGYKVTE